MLAAGDHTNSRILVEYVAKNGACRRSKQGMIRQQLLGGKPVTIR